jgi:NAD-dependent DNA ligase
MSTTVSSEPTKQSGLETLSNEEKSIYHELQLLSERIRTLDAIYYGRKDIMDDSSSGNLSEEGEVSDEEYDALARKEAEICTNYPHLLALLEKETGLGSKTTRFGGRVGQL